MQATYLQPDFPSRLGALLGTYDMRNTAKLSQSNLLVWCIFSSATRMSQKLLFEA